MPLEYRQGDLFAAGDLNAFAHGCNCAGVMGKGIALEFKRRYPRMYEEYRQRCLRGQFDLGDVFTWSENSLTIFNLATQSKPGSIAQLVAIETALRSMTALGENLHLEKIGLPRIGAGLGQLNWELVKAAIERVAASTTVTLVIFDFQP
ncbi:MAG TPA: macro domain-containing protein [Phototrophicaceae bacterium]|nr:macro domain-containing protein [Phototrophicaceae bacterium]